MTSRRRFLSAAAALLAAAPGARAQDGGRVVRVGILRPTAAVTSVAAFSIPEALRELGYVEGRNLVVEHAYADGRTERLPALARELVGKRVDAIVTFGAGATRAVRDATTTIPIVMFGNFDPVAQGIIPSLARPGGNVTGILIAADGTLAGKKLELLREAVPKAVRIAMLLPDDPNIRIQVQEVERAAAKASVTLSLATVRGGDYEGAFRAIVDARAQALFVAATTYFARDRKTVIALAAKHRLPAIYEWSYMVDDGGLMAYGTSQSELYRRVAVYVDRVVRGTPPGELPVEQPAKYELVVNAATARALGLVLPQSLLLRADRVVA